MEQEIVRAAIHPAIGVARVGNSEEGFFYGPETPDEDRRPDSYRDSTGAIKRQAARFRIYGYDKNGQVVREISAKEQRVGILWRVHLANRKASWYQFRLPLDIPDAKLLDRDKDFNLRNQEITDRNSLIIDAGRQSYDAAHSGTQVLDAGKIRGQQVYLGELRCDGSGPLTVLGGRGVAASFTGKPVKTVDNDGWYDDVSDGPVTAVVTLDGEEIPVDPAWVVVAPPNYAPAVKTLRTLYDLLRDIFVSNGALELPTHISFTDDIEPILQRFCDLQWVNHGFATHFGWKGPQHFLDPSLRARLSSPDDSHRELRRQVYLALRDYDRDGKSPMPWPWFYGDGMASRPKSVLQHMVLSDLQQWMMQRWADGDFTPGPVRKRFQELDTAPVDEQPGLLDRAALDYCLADAFHPGCEVTWPIRHASMFMAPFRIRHRDPQQPEPCYGKTLTPDKALAVDGPLYGQLPGGLTRWMATPWHTDTASCRSGYESMSGLGPRYDPYLPTFWPARVPNHVLTESDFAVVDSAAEDTKRKRAFANRAVWLRGLKGPPEDQRRQMINDWYKLGIVETRPYKRDDRFPRTMQVESTPFEAFRDAPDQRNLVNLHVPEGGDSQVSEAQAAAAIAQAITQAIAQTGFTEEQISAGYVEKVDPHRDLR